MGGRPKYFSTNFATPSCISVTTQESMAPLNEEGDISFSFIFPKRIISVIVRAFGSISIDPETVYEILSGKYSDHYARVADVKCEKHSELNPVILIWPVDRKPRYSETMRHLYSDGEKPVLREYNLKTG